MKTFGATEHWYDCCRIQTLKNNFVLITLGAHPILVATVSFWIISCHTNSTVKIIVIGQKILCTVHDSKKWDCGRYWNGRVGVKRIRSTITCAIWLFLCVIVWNVVSCVIFCKSDFEFEPNWGKINREMTKQHYLPFTVDILENFTRPILGSFTA